MSRRAQLLAFTAGAAVLAAGLAMWRIKGVAVWLEQGLAYCF